MPVILMKQLLEAGVHFGHQTRRWNPKMNEYIFTERNSIHIIDLQKTVKKVDEAYDAMRELAEKGDILFVGTKKQAQDSIKEEAQRCGQFYVNYRWLGGTLTNFVTIKKRVARLEELRRMEADGSFELRTKKEVAKLKLEMTKLDQNLGGIVGMVKLPAALFIVDTKKEHNAVVKLITAKMADAVIEAHQGEDATSEGMDLDSADAKAATAEVAEEQAVEEAGEKSIEEIASES